jgi:hypothetical protein
VLYSFIKIKVFLRLGCSISFAPSNKLKVITVISLNALPLRLYSCYMFGLPIYFCSKLILKILKELVDIREYSLNRGLDHLKADK